MGRRGARWALWLAGHPPVTPRLPTTESPSGRRSLCYDHAALEARKEHKPQSSAVEMAAEMGIDLLELPRFQWTPTRLEI